MWYSAVGCIVTLTLGMLMAPLAADAQPATNIPQVGILSLGSPELTPPLAAFRQGLRELGYVEGRNIAIAWRLAGDSTDRLPALASELVRLKVDVIFAINTPAVLAAKHATGTIPIIMTRVSDPVRTGLVDSLARPGGNITGLTTISPEFSPKRLELLREVLPGVSRLALLWNSANTGHTIIVQEMEAASQQLGIQLQVLGIQGPEEMPSAFEAVTKGGAGALLVIDDLVISSLQTPILELATQSRLPVISQFREFVEAGA